jgi:hypothetical protein
MTLTPSIRNQAERVLHISLAEAAAIPNLHGRIVAAMLKAHGFYTCTVGTVKTLYIRREAA